MRGFFIRVLERAFGVCLGTFLFITLLAIGQPYMIVMGEKAEMIEKELKKQFDTDLDKVKKKFNR